MSKWTGEYTRSVVDRTRLRPSQRLHLDASAAWASPEIKFGTGGPLHRLADAYVAMVSRFLARGERSDAVRTLEQTLSYRYPRLDGNDLSIEDVTEPVLKRAQLDRSRASKFNKKHRRGR